MYNTRNGRKGLTINSDKIGDCFLKQTYFEFEIKYKTTEYTIEKLMFLFRCRYITQYFPKHNCMILCFRQSYMLPGNGTRYRTEMPWKYLQLLFF